MLLIQSYRQQYQEDFLRLLFLLTNILIIATISIVTSLLGLHGYLSQHGLDYKSLAIFCAIWGMGGSFISLLLSRFMAKQLMRVRVINPNAATGDEQRLVTLVHQLAQRAGLTHMPEVGIYNSPESNAFATGASKRKSLVAVSSGLLSNMNTQELEGVLGHEISHIANGDMVTMTLIQGAVNAFALFLSRIVAYAVASAVSSERGDSQSGGISYMTFYICSFIFDIVFTILGSVLVAAFSRWREFRADAGGAKLAGKSNMIHALQRLQSTMEVEDNRAPSMATLKISGKPKGVLQWFATHPSIKLRIQRLEHSNY